MGLTNASCRKRSSVSVRITRSMTGCPRSCREGGGAPERIPASVLYREIRYRGSEGSETRAKQFVRGLVPVAAPEPVVRLETEPGRQMQADWAWVGRDARPSQMAISSLLNTPKSCWRRAIARNRPQG